MALVEVLYPFGGAKRGDRITVPDDKVGALRRLHWAQEISASAPLGEASLAEGPAPRPKRRKVQEKEPGIDGSLST